MGKIGHSYQAPREGHGFRTNTKPSKIRTENKYVSSATNLMTLEGHYNWA